MLHLPSAHFSSIMQPSFPKVAITNLSLGSLKIIETNALGIDDVSVHAYIKFVTNNYFRNSP
jgi:hypothetical protein